MKSRIINLIIVILTIAMVDCKKNDIDGQTTELTDPDAISKVLIIPDAERVEGQPPQESSNSGHVTITNETPEISGISGEDMIVSYRYKYASPNVTSPIRYVILYIDGASSYFKIPVQTVGQSGVIHIPIRIPSGYVIPPENERVRKCGIQISKCTVNGALECSGDPTCMKGVSLTPRAGDGRSVIDGVASDATAACDVDYGGYGKGYVIMVGSKMIILYNLGQGSFQIGNFENIPDLFNTQTPFALYMDSATDIYASVSGYATVKGKVVSVNMVMKSFDGKTKQIAAVGNCQ